MADAKHNNAKFLLLISSFEASANIKNNTDRKPQMLIASSTKSGMRKITIVISPSHETFFFTNFIISIPKRIFKEIGEK